MGSKIFIRRVHCFLLNSGGVIFKNCCCFLFEDLVNVFLPLFDHIVEVLQEQGQREL